ncbi:MAG: hypothetical protein DRP76_01365 [Candidatus Omnitrophota bacterium]|nr:MAG: hypothetical protein DRP76_01365 [Candidatus Omnitrophota bacterium]
MEHNIKERAELKIQVKELKDKLLEMRQKLSQLSGENKELSLKIDDLENKKEEIGKNLRYKERIIQLISKDLVNEKEKNKDMQEQLSRLREENAQLKQELVMLNKEKVELTQKLRQIAEEKEKLEGKVSQVEKVLKEKVLLFSQLKEELSSALEGKKKVEVKLPPIVVSPKEAEKKAIEKEEIAPISERRLEGTILAVNTKERFAIIDLGENNGVEKGMKFSVIRDNRNIATIEVIETRREVSAADIKEVKSGYSLQEGDQVISQ